MPLFEFKCQKCKTKFEELCLSNRDVERAACPECKSHDVAKLLSVFGFHSRGGDSSSLASSSKCSSCQKNSCRNCS